MIPQNERIAIHRKLRGLLSATLAGLAAYAGITYVSHWALAWICQACFGTWPGTPSLGNALLLMIVGPIFAVPACILVGLPVWTLIDRRLDRRRRTAMVTGAAVGAVIGVGSSAVLGWGTGLTLAFYGHEPAPTFGWWPEFGLDGWRGMWNRAMAAVDIARFATAGGLAALIARRSAGIGKGVVQRFIHPD